jgi:phasin family protein
MSNEILKNVTAYTKSAYESTKELGQISVKSASQIGEQQIALFSLAVESGAKQLSLLGSAKTYKDVVNGQSELAAEISGKVLGITRNTADILTETRDEVAAWVEKQVKAGVEAVSAFTPKAA